METTEIPPHLELKAAREKLHLSIEKVANELYLPTSVIIALENAQYENLHGEPFVLGSLRSYTKLLGIDSNDYIEWYKKSRHINQVVESVTQEKSDVVKPKVAKAKSQRFKLQSQHQKYRTGYGVAAAIALLIFLGVKLPAEFSGNKEIHLGSNQTIAVDTAVGTTVISSIDSLPSENPTQDMLPVMVDEKTTESNVGQSSEASANLTENSSVVDADKSSLSFVFSADCWVEVLDGNNEKIVSSLQRANERLELTGKPPFKITLGYAPGVALTYNSQPVSIDTNSENIAKLVLGNS